jgi:glycosyltransferase involved in cell wall biosynthesis
MNSILIITYEFPFGRGETFLESEVEYLSKSFEKIWIMPARSVWSPNLFKSNMLQNRELPDNFNIYIPDHAGCLTFDAIAACFEIRKLAVIGSAPTVPRYIREKIAWREALKAGLLSGALKKFSQRENGLPYAYSYWKGESATALAYLAKKKILYGFVSRCHGGDLYDEVLTYPFRPYDRLIAWEVDSILPVSLDGAIYLEQKGIPCSKIAVHRLGVKKAQQISKPSDDGILRIVSCSNLIPVKRVDIIAKALTKLNLPFQWTHFGDGSERNQIEKIVAQFPLFGQALLPGRVPNQVVLNHYASYPVDVFINVSSSEGVPVSIMEALAHRVPCIVTDVGGTGELIDDSCGILLEDAITSELLAIRLAEIHPRSNDWLNKRNGALRRWEEKASAEKNYSKFSRFLKNCATRIR